MELRVLRHFYYKAGGDQWKDRTGWPSTPAGWRAATVSNAAGWVGLTVAAGDITALRSNGNDQRGTLPADLGDLRALTVLHVSNAPQLSGPLPPTLYQLTYLRFVTTALNGQISPQIGRLTQLQHFSVFNCQFSGPLPRELSNLGELTQLQLDYSSGNPPGLGNHFSGGIPKELGQLTKLTSLTMGSQPLGGTIPAELGNLRNLTVLTLEDAHLTGSVPIALLQLPQLQTLYLGDTKANAENLAKLSREGLS